MASPLDALEPQSLWQQFDAIRQIPRPSKKEEKIREHMKAFAKERSLEVREDAAGNICIAVPATPGHEKAETVVIQGHMDMVCEKNSETTFDFDNDPIDVMVDGDWVTARGTTLGADNGLGIAAALACVVDESIVHGPLELLFTVDEETGLTGAMNLDGSLLTGKKLLNLDSEDDGVLFVGCAGGQGATIVQELKYEDAPKVPSARLEVSGLRGGHSGLDIGENRGNAIRILARCMEEIRREHKIWLASLEGGSAHNAIPRESRALFAHQAGELESIQKTVERARQAAVSEYGAVEPAMKIELVQDDTPTRVLTADTTDTLLRLLIALPHGALAMSRDIEGLVETSNNLATVSTGKETAEILLSSRSSVASAIDSTIGQIRAIGQLAGAKVVEHEGYPAWEPNMDSKLLALARKVFTDIWGNEPKVTAIHAGLECGLVGEKVPGMDMISFGPELESVHSPDERAQISSSVRFFEALRRMLAELA